MDVRVRFAPSPTGQIHIGNIRTAIFNWLYARHNNGKFLIRVEDTDRERSTQEAIDILFSELKWIGLNYDETPIYQSKQIEHHREQAEKLLDNKHAYKFAKGEGDEAVLFNIPWDDNTLKNISTSGQIEISIHPDIPVKICKQGLFYASISKKGKPIPTEACLAGFKDLSIIDSNNQCLFQINDEIQPILNGEKTCEIKNGQRLRFLRREVYFDDLIKGRLSKPLDSMKDFVIVRGNGSPVFHLANVCDDILQNITHIIRGDDHIENTYRHTLIFQAIDAELPSFTHIPMITNECGKPYSKRDGDAFLSDLRDMGYLPEAILNYLTLLGWSPDDDTEKMGQKELISRFTLDRVQNSPAKMDQKKLLNLNGQYMEEIPPEEFSQHVTEIISDQSWGNSVDPDYLDDVAKLMQSRTKTYNQVQDWSYFFTDNLNFDEKITNRHLQKPGIKEAFSLLVTSFSDLTFELNHIESCILDVTESIGVKPGKLNLPLRIALTGTNVGAGIYEIILILGKDKVIRRLDYAINNLT